MHRSSKGRARIAAFMAIVFMAPFAGAQSFEPVQTLPEPVHEKIDPRLQLSMNQLEDFGFVREGAAERVRQDLRVVIELAMAPEDPSFETSIARDRVADVREGVAQRQTIFLDRFALNATPATRAAVRIIDQLELQYMIVAEVDTGDAVLELARRDDVKFLWNDNLNQLMTVQGRQVTGSTTAASAGHTGAGVGVAVIDTNFDLLHTELGGSTSLPNSIVKGGYNYSTPGGPIHSQVWNDCYHGTGTASIVRRYAPGVHLYTLVVFPNAYDSVIANAINWCVTNKNGVGGGSPIRVISMSLGGGRYYSPQTSGTMHSACGTALSNGIVCLAASGNDGWSDSMGSPAASTNTLSIGSTWDAANAPYSPFPPAYCSDSSRLLDERACYSDTASFLDLYAPSEQVICAQCGGGTFALGGTSSATPAAAGLVAQFLHARPSYIGNMSGIRSLFQAQGVSVIGDTSKRRIDLMAAINASGGGGGPAVLDNGTTYNYSVGLGAVLNYTIQIPANATNLVVTITGTGDADLYVKRTAINWPAEQGFHNEAEFKAPYIGGSAESVTFPAPAQATWNVLVHGYAAASGTIRATWSVGGGGATWHNVSWVRETPHNYSNNQVYSYTYSHPSATQIAVHFERLTTEANYDFLRVKNAAGTVLFTESGNKISGGTGSAFGRTDGWAIISGNSITIELTTDYSVTAWGYRTDVASAYY